MNAADLEVLDRDPAEFFAPAPTSLIDGLLAEYQARRAQIDRVVEIVAGDLGNVMDYFGSPDFHVDSFLAVYSLKTDFRVESEDLA